VQRFGTNCYEVAFYALVPTGPRAAFKIIFLIRVGITIVWRLFVETQDLEPNMNCIIC
jgi:hypothetical protein